MRWQEAIARVRKPDISNLDAAGLLLFVRAVHRRYSSRYGLPPFDVVGFALPAFGWNQPGDRLVVTHAQARASYAASDALWGSLDALAADLDELGQPFELVTMPQGTKAKFKELADYVQRELAGAGGRMGAITAAEARKSVDRSRELAITNAKKAGAPFVFVQASADGSVFTDQGELDAMQASMSRANDDDQILAAGIWNASTGKLVTQKAGALEVRASAEPPTTPPAPSPVEPSPPKKKPDSGIAALFPWLLLLAIADATTKKTRRAGRVW